MKLAGTKVPPDTLFLAKAVDDLNLLIWAFSENANSSNKPKAIAPSLLEGQEQKKQLKSFRSGADFMRYWNNITKGVNNGK